MCVIFSSVEKPFPLKTYYNKGTTNMAYRELKSQRINAYCFVSKIKVRQLHTINYFVPFGKLQTFMPRIKIVY